MYGESLLVGMSMCWEITISLLVSQFVIVEREAMCRIRVRSTRTGRNGLATYIIRSHEKRRAKSEPTCVFSFLISPLMIMRYAN